MSIEITSSQGQIIISDEVIADVVGLAATECAGVVGMASQKRVKDGVAELLKRENYGRGIVVRKEDNILNVDLHIIVLYGLPMSEIATTVQSRVKHAIEQIIGLTVTTINIIIEDVKVDNT